jgi:hypothetical protein
LVLCAVASSCTARESASTAASTTGRAVPGYRQVACPRGGSTRKIFAKPRLPRPGEITDFEPTTDLAGWRIVRGADVALPSGRLLVTGGEYLGADGTPTDVGVKPGRYPWFLILAKRGRYWEPAFSQLVLDSRRSPVRWEDDRRFGWGTDGGMGFIGSPEAASTLSVLHTNWDRLIADLGRTHCVAFENSKGRNFVVYDNGFGDGGFPGTAGFDARGRLVAITWILGPKPWVLGGLPGTPPTWVQKIIGCRRRLIAAGVSRATSMRRCAKYANG